MSDLKQLVLNTAWCKGCGICVEFCPKHALTLQQGKVAMVKDAQCVLCGQCELRCPDYAIFIKEQGGEETQWVKTY